MISARTIASLYARRRRLILGLQDFERRAEVYRSAIADVEANLRALVPLVKPFKLRKRCPYFTSREFTRGFHEALRAGGGKVLAAEDIAVFLMRQKRLDISDSTLRKALRRRVCAMRRRIKRRDGNAT